MNETLPNLLKEFKASGLPKEDMEKFIDAFFKHLQAHDARLDAEYVKGRSKRIAETVDLIINALGELEASLAGSWEDEDGHIDEIRKQLNDLKLDLSIL